MDVFNRIPLPSINTISLPSTTTILYDDFLRPEVRVDQPLVEMRSVTNFLIRTLQEYQRRPSETINRYPLERFQDRIHLIQYTGNMFQRISTDGQASTELSALPEPQNGQKLESVY